MNNVIIAAIFEELPCVQLCAKHFISFSPSGPLPTMYFIGRSVSENLRCTRLC